MSRKSSFNLDRFYQDLQRVESSLGRADTRKTANSPLPKQQPLREDRSKPLAAFKRQLPRKELAKTRINLDMPYEHLKYAPPHREDPKPSHYRFSQLSGESREGDAYSNVRQRLMCWRREEGEGGREAPSSGNSKVLQKSEVDDSQYSQFLEKTMETPANQHHQDVDERAGDKARMQEQLLRELTRRNQVYQHIQAECGQERSYYRKSEDLSLRLQEHFRTHNTMRDIIHQIKRLCKIEECSLGDLLRWLQERRAQSSEESLL